MKRRTLLAAGAALAMPAVVRAGSKPEKLVFVGDNGPWHFCLVEEVAPAFEKATGIKIDFTLLPIDALSARLKAELNSGSPGIDVIQWTAPFAGWLAPHMADHTKLLADNAGRHPDFDWDDFLPPVRDFASYQGKLLGIPYRVTTSILNYQKPLLAEAGFTTPPGDWDSFLKALQATTKPPERYGLGIWGRQGPAMVGGFSPFLRGNGGRYFDPATLAIEINDPKAVEALEYYGDLMTRYKVVVPDSITWEFDEIIAGPLRDDDHPGAVWHADKRSKTIEDRRPMGLGARPGSPFRRGQPGLAWWLDVRRSGSRKKQRVGVRVHPIRYLQGVDAPVPGERERAAADIGAERPDGAGPVRLGPGAGAVAADGATGAERTVLAGDGVAVAQRHFRRVAGAENREGGAGRGRIGLAADAETSGSEADLNLAVHCSPARHTQNVGVAGVPLAFGWCT
jgi:hypothetical protein